MDLDSMEVHLLAQDAIRDSKAFALVTLSTENKLSICILTDELNELEEIGFEKLALGLLNQQFNGDICD